LLERIEFESFWLGGPAFADIFVRREASQSFEPPSVVVGVDEVGEEFPPIKTPDIPQTASKVSQSPFWMPIRGPDPTPFDTLTSIVPAEHLPASGIDQMHAGASQAGE
jgi:hypothetical protein